MTTATAPFRLPDDLSAEAVGRVIDAVAYCYVNTCQGDGGALLMHEEPTVVATVLAAQLFRLGEIERVMLICDADAMLFWIGMFEKYTELISQDYYGSYRHSRRSRLDPHVLITTADTVRPELAVRVKDPQSRSRGTWTLGPLGEELVNTRTLWLFDNLDRLDDRGLETHRGFDHFFTEARKNAHQRLIGFRFPGLGNTANAYDLGRLFCPSRMPSVREFTTEYCFPMLTEQPVLRPDRREAFHRLFSGVVIS